MSDLRYRVWDKVHQTMLTPSVISARVNPLWGDGAHYFALMPNGKGLIYGAYGLDNPDLLVLEPDDFEVMLSTGTRDGANKEIFEGDLIHWDLLAFDSGDRTGVTRLVVWDEFRRVFEALDESCIDLGSSGVGIVGNIYENPEVAYEPYLSSGVDEVNFDEEE